VLSPALDRPYRVAAVGLPARRDRRMGTSHMAKLLIGLLQADTGGATFQALVNTDRLALVKESIEKLAARAKSVDCGLFAAPEYLFSNENSNQPIGLAGSGKYYARGITEQQKEDNVEALRKLSDTHKTLIIIPGTMAWLKPFDREKGIARHQSAEKALRHPGGKLRDRTFKARRAVMAAANDAGQQGYKATAGYRGGADYGGRTVPRTTEKINMIKENALKDIKILRNSLNVIWNSQVLHKYNKVADYHEVLDMASQPSVFVPGDMARQTRKLFNRNFGFEICLDHAYNMLGFGKPKRLTDVLDIHVVLSASVEYDNTDLSEGGLFIHASSDKSETGVWMIKGNKLLTIDEDKTRRDEMGNGCRMRYFETEAAIDLR
jgi:predicted amidohydrolase